MRGGWTFIALPSLTWLALSVFVMTGGRNEVGLTAC